MDRRPAEATINRALSRLGLQDGVRRMRQPAPPRAGPAVLTGRAELDCFDFIEDLKIADADGHWLTCSPQEPARLAHRCLGAEPKSAKGTILATGALAARWAAEVCQFDNDNVFQGARGRNAWAQSVACVCSLKLFRICAARARHAEHIESFNALWQAKVWQRYRVAMSTNCRCTRQYIAAHRAALSRLPKQLRHAGHCPRAFSL